jgi:tetratricopeptide (TPR) repeat protein
LDPKHVRAYVGRGACYANQRKYAAALKDFDRALEIVPDDARATSYKAAVTEKMEKVSRARDDWSTRGGPAARKEDVDSLRARVLNPARGLEALRRGETTTKSYDLELGDDDDDSKDRRSDGKRRIHKVKRRKKDRKSDRRGRSDHKSSRKSSKRSRRDESSSSSSSYGSPARRK